MLLYSSSPYEKSFLLAKYDLGRHNEVNFSFFYNIHSNFCTKWLPPLWFFSEKFPFENFSNQNFYSLIYENSQMNKSSVGKYTNDNRRLIVDPTPNFKLLFNQFNNVTVELKKKNPENFINCKNLDTNEIQKMEIEPNSLSLFHINSCSLNKIF